MTLLALSLLAFSCSGGGDLISPETPQEITISDSEINSVVIGSTFAITLEAPGSWAASKNQPWVSVTPNSGQKGTYNVQIKINTNDEGKTRTAKGRKP